MCASSYAWVSIVDECTALYYQAVCKRQMKTDESGRAQNRLNIEIVSEWKACPINKEPTRDVVVAPAPVRRLT